MRTSAVRACVFGLAGLLCLGGGVYSILCSVSRGGVPSVAPRSLRPLAGPRASTAPGVETLSVAPREPRQEQLAREVDKLWTITGRVVALKEVPEAGRDAESTDETQFAMSPFLLLPVAGAALRLWPDNGLKRPLGAEPLRSGVTDEDGRFRLEDVVHSADLRLEIDDAEHGIAVEAIGISADGSDETGERRVDLGEIEIREGYDLVVFASDVHGNPVPGQELRLLLFEVARAVWYTFYPSPGADGEYRFERLPPGNAKEGSYYLAQATAPGHACARAEFQFPHPDPIQLILEPSLSISGRVLTLEGQPIQDATVAVDIYTGAFSSDEEGRFQATGLGKGDYLMRVEADGFAAEERSISLPPFEEVTFRLSPILTLRGVVVDAESGEPIDIAWVSAAGDASNGVGVDSQGKFELQLAQGEHELYVRGHMSSSDRSYVPSVVKRVWVSKDALLENLTVRLQRGFSVTGLVLDKTTRKPLAKSQLRLERILERSEGEEEHLELRFDERASDAGSFRVEGLLQGDYLFEVDFQDYLKWEGVLPLRPGMPDLEFALQRGEMISGLVTDEDGTPVQHAEVTLTPQELQQKHQELTLVLQAGGSVQGTVEDLEGNPLGNARIEESGRGDDAQHGSSGVKGRFCLSGLEPGLAVLLVSHAGYAPKRVAVPSAGAKIRLAPLARIHGRVEAPGPLPFRKGEVLAYVFGEGRVEESAPLGTDGSFFLDLPAGSYVLDVEIPRWVSSPRRLTVRDGERQEVVLNLEREARVKGHVRAAGSGEPIEYCTILAYSFDRRGLGVRRLYELSDSHGYFELSRCPAGPLDLLARRAGWLASERLALFAEPGKTLEVDIELQRGQGIQGQVLDELSPVANARLRLLRQSGGEPVETQSSLTGHFEFPGLGAGHYVVELHFAGLVRRESVRLDDGALADVDFNLRSVGPKVSMPEE